MPAVAVETVPAVALSRPVKVLMERLAVKRLVEEAVVEKRAVVVALVPVALVKVKSVRSTVVPKRLVKVPVVEKKEVVVALVPVAVLKVKRSKWPRGPETDASERVAETKVPPSVRLPMAEETWETSLLDWRVTTGRVSATRISRLSSGVLYVL